MLTRLTTLLVWALVAASAVYWGLQLFGKPQPVPPNASLATNAPPLQADLRRLLGQDMAPAAVAAPVAAAETPADARFVLIGVVNPRGAHSANQGLALIAIDGQPARTYRVGATVEGDRVLQQVSLRGAVLGPKGGAAQVSLSIPAPPEANRGRLDGKPVALPPGLPPGAEARALATQQSAQPQIQADSQPQVLPGVVMPGPIRAHDAVLNPSGQNPAGFR
jgi:general secretion pathway protein C